MNLENGQNPNGQNPKGQRNLYIIPSYLPFAETLVEGLSRRKEPGGLSRYIIFLPTRRSCRIVEEIFLRKAEGNAVLLPHLVPMGDIADWEEETFADDNIFTDEAGLQEPIDDLRRLFLLARLTRSYLEKLDIKAGLNDFHLALSLAGLLDEMILSNIPREKFSLDLVPENFSIHWEKNLEFLNILKQHWPVLLKQENRIDAAARLIKGVEYLTRYFDDDALEYRVVAAGSTGSVSAVAGLFDVISSYPWGEVILPGLAENYNCQSWEGVLEDAAHPWHMSARLLKSLKMPALEVQPWPDAQKKMAGVKAERKTRMVFLSHLFSPTLEKNGERKASRGLDDVDAILCHDPQEEARCAALLLREMADMPDKTAALITPDSHLALRVSAVLRHWGIEVNVSAGMSLNDTATGAFLLELAEIETAFAKKDGLSPNELSPNELSPKGSLSALIALLRNPLVAMGGRRDVFLRALLRFEKILRNPRDFSAMPPSSLSEAMRLLAKEKDQFSEEEAGLLMGAFSLFNAAVAERLPEKKYTLSDRVKDHIAMAEKLTLNDQEKNLWHAEGGKESADLIRNFLRILIDQAKDNIGDDVRDDTDFYHDILAMMMRRKKINPRHDTHPRLFIHGALEARLLHFDRVILAGLNEGTWPIEVNSGPWLPRQARQKLGLLPPEWRIGLSAHDFVQIIGSSDQVFLLSSEQRDGQPVLPSRWLTRMHLANLISKDSAKASQIKRLASSLTGKGGEVHSLTRPQPNPPKAARPVRLSPSAVELWWRNPYGFYARYILKLKKLPELDAPLDKSHYGTLIHRLISEGLKEYESKKQFKVLSKDQIRKIFLTKTDLLLKEDGRLQEMEFFWRTGISRLLNYFIDGYLLLPAGRSFFEEEGEMVLDINAEKITIAGRADLIRLSDQGGAWVIDYKTGTIPSNKDYQELYLPQLPLLAAILGKGGFEGIKADQDRSCSIEYWKLDDKETPKKLREIRDAGLIGDYLDKLSSSIKDSKASYRAVEKGEAYAPAYDDYKHLARTREWGREQG